MSALTLNRPVSQDGVLRWTVDQYYRMAEVGIIPDETRVELLRGQIILMSPVSAVHAACVFNVKECLDRLTDNAYYIRTENPVSLPTLQSEPQPDVIVAPRPATRYAHAHPGADDLLLVVEVAFDSLDRDRSVKAPLYAEAGVHEYWIVNLVDRQLERYLLSAGATAYGEPQVFAEADAVPHGRFGEVAVVELLPARLPPAPLPVGSA